MELKSLDFEHNGNIPQEFTCQGKDINPGLMISGVPAGTKTLVLIMDDPDAPIGTWDHWILFDIPPSTKMIEKNSVVGQQGKNSWGRNDYGGPCPPSGTHRYFFKLYALDISLNKKEGVSKKEIERALQGHILAQTELVGLYKKTY